ncbi:very short patch repair endonuclease [Planctomycetota bacterium]
MDTVDKATRSRIMTSIRSKGNRSTERRLRMLLVRSGISGWRLLPEGVAGNPDFIFPDLALAVFVDGCFWHGCPRCGHRPSSNRKYWNAKLDRTKARDRRLRAKLRRQGWSVIGVWEHELRQPDRAIAKLRRAMSKCHSR